MLSPLLCLSERSSDPSIISLGESGFAIAPEHLQDEARLLRALDDLQAKGAPIAVEPAFLSNRKQHFINNKKIPMDADEQNEQARSVFDELFQPQILTIITGPPGAAKTTVTALWVNLVAEALPQISFTLIAQERTALHRLQDKIHSRQPMTLTLDEALQDRRSFPAEGVVILDEASLCGTRAMAHLVEKAAAVATRRLILIGDDKQLSPSEVGQPFRWLRETGKGHHLALSHSFRQKTKALRHVVEALHRGDRSALDKISIDFAGDETPNSLLVAKIRHILGFKAPDKTLVIVHGPDKLVERLKVLCPGFRLYSISAAQGLAVDDVVLIVAAKINLAEMLVGCSRQRFVLDIVVDSAVYPDKVHLQSEMGDYPKLLMAVDVVSEDGVRALAKHI